MSFQSGQRSWGRFKTVSSLNDRKYTTGRGENAEGNGRVAASIFFPLSVCLAWIALLTSFQIIRAGVVRMRRDLTDQRSTTERALETLRSEGVATPLIKLRSPIPILLEILQRRAVVLEWSA